MHRFDYRFLAGLLPAGMAGLSNIIYDLKGRNEVRRLENEPLFLKLREQAIIQSAVGSNAIEGVSTSDKRIRELLEKDAPPLTHDEKEILGYKKALQEIFQDGFRGNLSENLVLHLHRTLLEGSSPEAGKYKSRDNWIQERSPDGSIRVRFVPVSAQEVPSAMEQWLLAYQEARQQAAISPLLLIACAVHDFLCIHPFMDGNGRVSRLLTVLLLQQEGFDIVRYISLEEKIYQYRDAYYTALKASSAGWHENTTDYVPVMTFFLQVLYHCYKDLDQKFLDKKAKKLPKAKQIEILLEQSFVPVSKGDISRKLPEISISTIERVLGQLMRDGKIEKIGDFKNARYRSLNQ